jgi:hypothetical protein
MFTSYQLSFNAPGMQLKVEQHPGESFKLFISTASRAVQGVAVSDNTYAWDY